MGHRSTIARVGALACAVAVLVATGSAAAQPTPPDASVAAANRSFRRGVELFDRGAFAEALASFKEAYALAPDFRVLFNIGQAHHELKDHASALSALRRYLAEGGSRVPPERRVSVEADVQALERRVARVRITVDAPGAKIQVDGQAAGESPLAAPLVVNAGHHELRAELEGRTTATAPVDVTEGQDVAITLRFAPVRAVSPPPAAAPGRSPLGYILLASGGVVLAASFVLDVVFVGNAIDDFEALRDRDDARAGDARGTVRTLRTTAIVGYASGAVLTIAGAAIALWPQKSTTTGTALVVRPSFVPGTSGGLVATGRF